MIRRCRDYVVKILDEYPDLPLLLLGDVAGRAFITKQGRFQITQDRGYAYDTNIDRPAFLTFHPSFVKRSQWYDPIIMDVWRHDLERAWDWAVGNFRYQDEFDYRTSVSPQDLIDYVRDEAAYSVYYQGKPLLACDIETTGLNPRVDKIKSIAMSRAFNDSISVSWPIIQNEVYDSLKEIMESPFIGKCWQNGLFDIEFLACNGIRIREYLFDTMYAHHCTLPDGAKYLKPNSLKFLTSIYTNLPPYKSEYTEVYEGVEVDVTTIQELACHDANATLQIGRKLINEQVELGLTKYFQNVLMPIMPTLNDMHVRGVRIDVDALGKMREEILPQLRRIEESLPSVNLNSTKQVAEFLIDLGVRLTKKTPKGAYRVDAETLREAADREENQDNADILEALLRYHDLKKLEGTYCTGLLKRLHAGRLHTSFSIGPSTGRLASANPNLQNIPDNMRHVFLPDPGMRWIKADYKQMELYIAALEYKDEKLLQALREGIDVHDHQQRLCFNDDYSASNKRQRRIAKTVIFGTLYGRGARAIAVAFGVSIAQAKKWQDAFFNEYPSLHDGQRRQIRETQKTGIVRSAFGNIRQTQEYTKVVNHPVQGGAAGVLCLALKNVNRFADLQPLLTVHDEIDFQVPAEELNRQVKIIRECMTAPVPQYRQFRFPVDIEIGTSWKVS